MTAAGEPEGGTTTGIRVSAALLAAYLAIVGWVFYDQATAWPHEGSWASTTTTPGNPEYSRS